jgi:Gpi18-like mannosyltransferase/predicted membrane-bound dolichyl-phosphate-mannose-protein mannosyltransferase
LPAERGALRSAVRSAGAALERTDRSAFSETFLLGGILFAGFLIRLLFIHADGFKNDVGTFEAWALTLAEHPMREFYDKAGFADYPPGYFFVLWGVGHFYKFFVHDDPGYNILKILVKLPAILMDLVDGYLIFALVRRFASSAWAFAAMALFVFNPAVIFISAYWGQVDSVAAGVTLGALLLIVNADRASRNVLSIYTVFAWLALAYSILIKPPAIVIVPLFLAFPFATRDGAVRIARLRATGLGVLAALVMAYDVAIAFHPVLNPIAEFHWLYDRYAYASGVYAYSSVNAFNLYALVHHFWESDTQIVPDWAMFNRHIGLPQYVWGILLLAVAVALVVSRYVQRREIIALLEGAMILSLGYFVLSTRMHERYIFNAMALAVPLVFYRRRYLYATFLLSATLLGNLIYSLDYLYVMDAKIQGVDAGNLMPYLSRPASFANVLTFFYLGYVFLGSGSDVLDRVDLGGLAARAGESVRRWFAPLEGLTAMTVRDWTIAGAMTAGSFVLTFVNYWFPAEKIFDEIYYARAGEEYLQHREIFEFTHPPLTKLIITFSMILFGGMHGLGDTGWGWRFMNLVVGALMVLVLYCFAKRILGSTLFASMAAGFLLFDGFHFAQSRIATPEITVAFFSLTTIYAFYRYWIAAQVRVAPKLEKRAVAPEIGALAVLTVLAFVLTFAVAHSQSTAARIVAFLYFELGAYLAVRVFLPRFMKPPALTSYADGSFVVEKSLETPDGGSVPAGSAAIVPGEATRIEKGKLSYVEAPPRIEYARGGTVRYATPEGEAVFTPDGTMQAGDAKVVASDSRLWLWLLSISAGCLAACKWNGLFDFFVVWLLVAVVVLQPYWSAVLRGMGRPAEYRPAFLGNPRGFSLDIVMGTMLFVGASVYVLSYIPYFTLGHGLGDLVELQNGMYWYHHNLKATHPYSSEWWQWPLLQIPVSYYYHDFRTGAALSDGAKCCVGEILALPNPVVWWLGLVSVPYVAWLAWRERSKGYILLITAYFIQWLPWIASPRLAFEYHFFPNLAIICIADAILMQRIWKLSEPMRAKYSWPRVAVGGYLAAVLIAFVFWYPVVSGTQLTYNEWSARMLTGLEGNNWINPHPGK